MPDGQEAKASPSLNVVGLPSEAGVEVQQLRTCLQEATYREQAIHSKLQALTNIIQDTQVRVLSEQSTVVSCLTVKLLCFLLLLNYYSYCNVRNILLCLFTLRSIHQMP